jgi:capsular polysaccharide biosynthesis protein
MSWLAAFWLGGVLTLGSRLVLGWWQVQRLRTRQTAPVEEIWLERLLALKARLGVSRPVALLQSALVETPTVIGWLRPVILLPASAVTGLGVAQLESILAHELAHIRRNDYLVNLFQRVVETFLFYHPAVWWISKCVREEREICCDDLALQVCESREVYARALSSLEEFRSCPPGMALAASGGNLVARIRRVLGVAPKEEALASRRARAIRIAVWTTLAVFVLFAFRGLFASPRLYSATARVIVNFDPGANARSSSHPSGASEGDIYWAQTEMERFQSKEVLTDVIRNFQIVNKWPAANGDGVYSQNKAYARLRARISVIQLPKTRVFTITARDENPRKAAQIANEIVYCYDDTVRKDSGLSRSVLVSSLSNALAEQDDELERLGAKLATLRGPSSGGPNASVLIEKAAEDLAAARSFRDNLYARLHEAKVDLRVSSAQRILWLDKADAPEPVAATWGWIRLE